MQSASLYVVLASCLLAAAVTGLTAGVGASATTGTEVTETLGLSASEGEVVMKHGAPDAIVRLGTPYYNPATGELGRVDKYLYDYRLRSTTSTLGLARTEQHHRITYLIQDGVVMGGGYVGMGNTWQFLGAAPWVRLLMFVAGLGLIGVGALAGAPTRGARLAASALAGVGALAGAVAFPPSLAFSLPVAFLLGWRHGKPERAA